MGRQYHALASVYDFLVPEVLLDPAGSVATFAEWVADLEPGAPVLDCACGPGHLAVGLAQAGMTVTATDASPAMTSRAAELARAHGVALTVETLTWEELGAAPWGERFAAAFCVGNSLVHAEGAPARREALRAMRRVLRPGGRLILTSRNWELVRAAGSRLSVGDRITVRGERRGLVIHGWALADGWHERHQLSIAVALLDDAGGVRTVAERLDLWPFRHEELLEDVESAGLRVAATTYGDRVERYAVVARRDA